MPSARPNESSSHAVFSLIYVLASSIARLEFAMLAASEGSAQRVRLSMRTRPQTKPYPSLFARVISAWKRPLSLNAAGSLTRWPNSMTGCLNSYNPVGGHPTTYSFGGLSTPSVKPEEDVGLLSGGRW